MNGQIRCTLGVPQPEWFVASLEQVLEALKVYRVVNTLGSTKGKKKPGDPYLNGVPRPPSHPGEADPRRTCKGLTVAQVVNNTIRFFPVQCKRWSCHECRPALVAKVRKLAIEGRPNKFLTLTVSTQAAGSQEHFVRRLRWAFRRLVWAARKKYPGAEIEYLALWELTKQGIPHLHVLLRAPYIPQGWISRQMNRLILSPIVDIRAVGSKRAIINYVSKYLTKHNVKLHGTPRYFFSKGWKLFPGPDEGELPFPRPTESLCINVPLDKIIDSLLTWGWEVSLVEGCTTAAPRTRRSAAR